MEHAIVSQEEWLAARKALLLKEKEATHLRDKLNADRMALPWVKVTKPYVFQTPQGDKRLADLFNGRSQLLVYHFMLGPGWDAGCPGCSFLADQFDGALPHIEHHDVTLTAVSRGTLEEIEKYKKRMGWKFPWVSSNGGDFNYDFHVSFTKEQLTNGNAVYNFESVPASADAKDTELPGMSAFYKDEKGQVFHTYSSYARGIEEWISSLMIFDRAPKGRNENKTMDFLRRHDEYELASQAQHSH